MVISILGRRLHLNQPQRLFQQIRTGYIILLPEVNTEQFEQNPLYKNGFPNIENITQEKCVTTLGKYLLDFEHGVRQVENNILEKENELDILDDIIDPLEDCGTKLETTWALVKALYIADKKKMPAASYISLHERARRARSLKYNSRQIYHFFKNYDVSKLTEEEQRVISKFLIEGKLNGLNLDNNKREMFMDISSSLAKEVYSFNERVQISSKRYEHMITNYDTVRNFPEEFLKTMSLGDPYKGPWNVTLKNIDKFLQYCPDRNLRWNVWLSNRQVASINEVRELNNSVTLETIRSLRRDLANVLGYESFAHMSMETKMAGSVENIQNTLGRVLEIARPQQEKEIQSLQLFAEENGFKGVLELWDVPYFERKQKISLYNWDDNKMREYFPYEKVLNGLIKTIQSCFNIRIEEAPNISTWHPDCKVYNIFEDDVKKPIASIFLDPFRRDNKLFTEIGQVISLRPVARAFGPSTPLAAIILNFSRPESGNKPSLLTLDDVSMLFSKFGEALQQVLSAVNYLEVSGLNYLEWDAVHIVSHFMSLLLTDPEVIKEISGHYSTKETIPVSNLTPILGHMPGFHLCKEIYLANLDISLHTSKEFWVPLIKKLWPEHFCFNMYKHDSHPLSFTASISQGMPCAVYSKLWSKMLAADAFNTFKTDPDITNIGNRFRDTFFAFGGGCHPSEVFRRFQGRDPTPEAFIASTFPNSL